MPDVRLFLIDGLRNGVGSHGFTGVNEVRLRGGRIVREGLQTTLTDMRLAKAHRSARARWRAEAPGPSVFVVSRERAKLGYFWRHAYQVARSGPYCGNVVNPDTGRPVSTAEDQLRRADFRKVKHSEWVLPEESGQTAQGNALGALAGACDRVVALTGTLLGGCADDVPHPLAARSARDEGGGLRSRRG